MSEGDEYVPLVGRETNSCQPYLTFKSREFALGLQLHEVLGKSVNRAIVRDDLDAPAQLEHEVQRVLRARTGVRNKSQRAGEFVAFGIYIEREAL